MIRRSKGMAVTGLWITGTLASTAWGQEQADADADLEVELAAELEQIQAEADEQNEDAASADGAAPQPAPAIASSMGLSNLLNPALSANGLVLAGYSSRFAGRRAAVAEEERDTGLTTGLHLQEVELRLSAVVDPFFRADITIAADLDEIEIEEAVLSTSELPHVTIRGGKIFAAVGRHNLLHTHAYPFLTAPLPWRSLLGGEGLKDVGLSVEVLLPLPFYTEVMVQGFNGEWDLLTGGTEDDPATAQSEFVPDARRYEDLAYLGHLKSVFELGDSATIELGGTYLGGRNGFRGWTYVVAGDLTLKWRPVEAERYTGIEWTTEYVWVRREGARGKAKEGGGYSQLRYQFAQRWWLQARAAILGLAVDQDGETYRFEALAAFVPSEFSTLRLQYALDHDTQSGTDAVHEVFLQALFSIGSHPSHAY